MDCRLRVSTLLSLSLKCFRNVRNKQPFRAVYWYATHTIASLCNKNKAADLIIALIRC